MRPLLNKQLKQNHYRSKYLLLQIISKTSSSSYFILSSSVYGSENYMFTKSLFIGFCFVVRGESPGCRLFGTASMLEWLRNSLFPQHPQGSSTERWSRNTLRMVTARVFYVIRGTLTKGSGLYLIISGN